jgi:ParB family transcriptional regulator, chromosome partitioning protein
MNMEKEIFFVHVDDIIPNRFQPREIFDETALVELSESIKEHGIIQPLVVRKIGDKYEIIAGERRYKASLLTGLDKVPVIIADLDDQKSAEVALAENIQRRDLTAIEEAKTYQKILKLGDLTQEELARRMGKAQPTIANKLRLLGLDDNVQQALLENKISERHARALLNLENKAEQQELLNQIINNKLTVRDTDNEIKARTGKAVQNISEEPVIEVIGAEIQPTEITSEPIFEIKPTPISEVQPMPIDNSTNIIELPTIEKEPTTNKFFMPLEEEEANMNMVEEPVMEQPKTVTSVPEFNPQNINIPVENDVPSVPVQPVPTVESQPINIPNYQNFQSTAVTNDLRTAINTIRQCVSTIEKYGFDVDSEEFDFEDIYQIIIKINK